VKQITVSRIIHAPPDRVFEAIEDPRGPFFVNNPFVNMHILGTQTNGIGTTYRWTFKLPFGYTYHFDEMITEWIKPERYVFKFLTGPKFDSMITLHPVNESTKIVFTICYQVAGIAGLFLPTWLMKFGANIGLHNIAKYLSR
jgi:hypothetical protein